uniref:Right handed beta helix domain-containing protein n=1 Tax=Hanusia phi TaxID=3032 RepID=A0A7S0EUZ4_9CRYP|mmetsp:Transcript_32351/g.72659  ORF Transcript_32351/g.72659 Transcript_32351/m.72659 type:complete len:332 (+) Transcript_32351:7-1002(+)
MTAALVVMLGLSVGAEGFMLANPPLVRHMRHISSSSMSLQQRWTCRQPSLRKSTMPRMASTLETDTSLLTMIEEAQSGDTIVLGKGNYVLPQPVVLSKDVTIKAEDGLLPTDVVIVGEAPRDKRGVMITVSGANVKLQGVKIVHKGGSIPGTLSNGLGSICMMVLEPGDGRNSKLSLDECFVTTETSTAVFVTGGTSRVYVDTCTIGPCGWDVESSSGYGICIFKGAHGEVLNTDVFRCSQSGIIAFYEGSTALVIQCDVGPCQLGGIAAEGQRAQMKASKVKLIDIEWKNCAEYDGGEVILLDEVQALVNGETVVLNDDNKCETRPKPFF